MITKEYRYSKYIETKNVMFFRLLIEYDYRKSFELVCELAEAARSDFPSLGDDSINVYTYSGGKNNNVMGIEFSLITDEIPDDYVLVKGFDILAS